MFTYAGTNWTERSPSEAVFAATSDGDCPLTTLEKMLE
jgi:hypothetical protein